MALEGAAAAAAVPQAQAPAQFALAPALVGGANAPVDCATRAGQTLWSQVTKELPQKQILPIEQRKHNTIPL